jgi:hypothetical protein
MSKEKRMKIEVVNKKAAGRPHGVYIGRPSVLGNPFAICSTCSREQAIHMYRDWLRQQWKAGGKVKKELVRLAQQYKDEHELILVCWCAPQACHGDVIRDAITAIVRKGNSLA